MQKNDFQLEKYIKLRQDLHKIPEIGFKEYKTKELLYSHFKTIPGFSDHAKVTEVGETGFFIDIWGTKQSEKNTPKTLISIRCDIDALPLIDKTGMPYSSTIPGFSHACGHDGHMAISTCAMDFHLSNLTKLSSDFGVRWLYQPAEEGQNGALEMIKGGCLKDVISIYGLHNLTLFDVGTIGCIVGPIMGRIDAFEIELTGKGGHGSAPQVCKNPIIPGTNIVQAISSIPSQEMPSEERCVATVCKFQSGHTFNVIPDKAYISGTVRSLKNENGEKMISRVKEISEGISKVYGCCCDVKVTTPGIVTSNEKKETEELQEIIKKYFVLSTERLPVMGSEDFSYYGQTIPSVFVMLGGRDETHTDYIHSSNYDFNDKSLGTGVEYFIRVIEKKSNCVLMD